VKQSARKLVGTFGVVALVVVYVIAAGAIYANFLGGQPWWVLLSFFAIAGLSWFFPAAWLIRWMAKPDG
jgi:RsiW-degrading membrane proteinase PrsW (M82 family)